MASVRERSGVVVHFDERAGHGELREASGTQHWFHCTAIADGSRSIDEQTPVAFTLVPGPQGRYEAHGIRPR